MTTVGVGALALVPCEVSRARSAVLHQHNDCQHNALCMYLSNTPDRAEHVARAWQADAKELRAYYEAAYAAVRRSSSECFIAISPRVRRQRCCARTGGVHAGP